MSVTRMLTATAVVALSLFAASAPAEAGRRTGTWKYSPEEVYANQRALRQQQHRNRYGYGGYGRPYGRRYERGYGYGQGYGYGRPRYVNPEGAAPIAGPSGGGPGTYGRP